MGERWAGELCQDNYLSTGYFSSEDQASDRWLYYRCRTEGQNTITNNGSNQVVDAITPIKFHQTHEGQDSKKFEAGGRGTAFWIADLTSAYKETNIKRGVRFLRGRKEVLIQDEITNSSLRSQWRMHTNATITYSSGGRVARE